MARSYKWANFAYQALQGGGLHLIDQTSASNIKIMVDQNAKTYTVGPYKIDITNGDNGYVGGTGSGTMRDLVYSEITGVAEFCQGSFSANVKFQGGGSKSSGVQVLDSGGSPISFPRFGQEFYVRYTTTLTEDIVEYITPSVSINYWTKFGGSFVTHKSTSMEFKMMQDNCSYLRDAVDSLNYVLIKESEKSWLIQSKGHGVHIEGVYENEELLETFNDSLQGVLAGFIAGAVGSWEGSVSKGDVQITSAARNVGKRYIY